MAVDARRRLFVDAVLGLSVTPSSVGLVLVEGQDGDGAAMDGERFEVGAPGCTDAQTTSAQAAAAVMRTEAMAADRGQRLYSIGVTWSDDADVEASLLLKSLSDSGFDNIVPVRLSEATDALARGIADVMGYQTTAVCVIEPEQLIALVVATDEGAAQTAVNHSVVTEEDLIGWLSAVFTRADWEPEALVLVGSAEDLDGLAPLLEDALSVPVFSPAEAQLALARGAAMASAQPGEFDLWPGEHDEATAGPAGERPYDRLVRIGPAAMLAAGALTFIASVSAALALTFIPDHAAAPVRTASESSASSAQPPAVAPRPLPPVPAPAAPAADAAPTEDAPASSGPGTDSVDPAPDAETPSAPVVDAAAPADDAPAPAPVDVPPAAVDMPPAPVDVVPPVAPPPEVAPPPVPEQRPGLMDRIRDKLAELHGQPAPPPPAPAPIGLPPQ
jgi:hypothetical protein